LPLRSSCTIFGTMWLSAPLTNRRSQRPAVTVLWSARFVAPNWNTNLAGYWAYRRRPTPHPSLILWPFQSTRRGRRPRRRCQAECDNAGRSWLFTQSTRGRLKAASKTHGFQSFDGSEERGGLVLRPAEREVLDHSSGHSMLLPHCRSGKAGLPSGLSTVRGGMGGVLTGSTACMARCRARLFVG
jgi:hypothetical protein